VHVGKAGHRSRLSEADMAGFDPLRSFENMIIW